MASTVGGTPSREAARTDEPFDEEAGYGWVVFAATMMAIVGSLNFIYGIAAISDSRFYARDVTYIFSDLNTFGWALLLLGTVQFCSAFGVLAQMPGARWVGIISASLNAIAQMLILPGSPFLALSLFAIDILVIYGLVAHGKRPATA
jgi:hypothetical protein